MACSDYIDSLDALKNYAFRDAFTCDFQSQFGSGLFFGLVVMAAMGMAVYIRTDDIVVPWAVMTVTAGVVLPWVTSIGVTVAVIVIAVVGGAAPIILIRRAETRP